MVKRRLSMEIPDLTQCTCGQSHHSVTKEIHIYPGAIRELSGLLERLNLSGTHTFICDTVTHGYAQQALSQVSGTGGTIICLKGDNLHADETQIGRLFMQLSDRPTCLLSVGSGTVTDIVRYVAWRMGIPFIAIATAPSMDGYASGVAALTREAAKETHGAAAPLGIICDIDWLAAAPKKMVAAGLGDVAGKATALFDWRMSAAVLGEAYCPEIAGITMDAYEGCLSSAFGLGGMEPEAVASLSTALVLSGLAIQLMGNSRPASGAEHHISHMLEMRAMARGEQVALHGDKVGIGTLLVIQLYARLFSGERCPDQLPLPQELESIRAAFGASYGAAQAIHTRMRGGEPFDRIEALQRAWPDLTRQAQALSQEALRIRGAIEQAGGPTTAAQMGISKDELRIVLKNAHLVRDRFTGAWLAYRMGQLDRLADEVIDTAWE